VAHQRGNDALLLVLLRGDVIVPGPHHRPPSLVFVDSRAA
jgi:hypothetical protein